MKKLLILIILFLPLKINALEIKCPNEVNKNEIFSCTINDENMGIITNINNNNIFNYQKVKYSEGKLLYADTEGISYSNLNKNIDIEIFFKVLESAKDNTNYKITFSNINLVNKNFENIFPENIIKEIRIKSDTNTLNNIDISPYKLNPSFDKNINKYSLTLDSDIINIKAEKNDPLSIIEGDIGTIKLKNGANILKIKVISESGLENIYEICVNKIKNNPPKKELKLKTLKVNGESIKLENNKFIYEYKVESNISKVNIEAVSYGNEKVIIDNKESLKYGENIINVTIKGEQDITYILKLYRKEPDKEENEIKESNPLNNEKKPISNTIINNYYFIIPLFLITILILLFIKNRLKNKNLIDN